jgi:hypothetical protein
MRGGRGRGGVVQETAAFVVTEVSVSIGNTGGLGSKPGRHC